MATESFLVTALPHSADPAEKVHVSLFVTHRLTPDGARRGRRRTSPTVSDWTARLARARVRLVGRTSGGASRRDPGHRGPVPARADHAVAPGVPRGPARAAVDDA